MSESVPEAVEYLESIIDRSPGGISQPQRIRFSDGRVYAVKFDNPFPNFGLRVLPAELMASRIARHIGVPVPAICVVNVSAEFLEANPGVAFRYATGSTQQPKPGACLGSEWIDDARPAWPHDVSKTPTNLAALAALFVAANLLCMNDDHARSYGNLLLDEKEDVWAIDWGHPFFLPEGCNNWSGEVLSRHVGKPAVVANPLVEILEVRAIVPKAAEQASQLPLSVIREAFHGIPEAWRSPNEGGVSNEDCEAAQTFLAARKERLPALIADIM
ncbi:MAG: hypothetical protein JXA57_21040 [Armatimonadetes bacterium]|nr:hypothetical protein [Armatimonadota bacterium]